MAPARDPLATIEAAYRTDVDQATWVRGLLATFDLGLGEPLGSVGYVFGWRDGRLEVGSLVGLGLPACEAAARGILEQGPDWANEQAHRAPWVLFSQHRFAEESRDPGLWDSVRRHLVTGVGDVVAVKGMDPSGAGVLLSLAVPEYRPLRPSLVRRWARVGAHLATALRLRRVLQRADGEAVLSPDGRCLHAEGEARGQAARSALREAALRMDRARGSLRRHEPDEALDLWRALVTGRWSLVDRFDSDGRRFLVARRNPPHAHALPGLTPRERQVASFLALGCSNKMIAYSLGLSESSVETHVRRALRKLGLPSRAALAGLLASLPAGARDPSQK